MGMSIISDVFTPVYLDIKKKIFKGECSVERVLGQECLLTNTQTLGVPMTDCGHHC